MHIVITTTIRYLATKHGWTRTKVTCLHTMPKLVFDTVRYSVLLVIRAFNTNTISSFQMHSHTVYLWSNSPVTFPSTIGGFPPSSPSLSSLQKWWSELLLSSSPGSIIVLLTLFVLAIGGEKDVEAFAVSEVPIDPPEDDNKRGWATVVAMSTAWLSCPEVDNELDGPTVGAISTAWLSSPEVDNERDWATVGAMSTAWLSSDAVLSAISDGR